MRELSAASGARRRVRRRRPDPCQRWREWLDHQYDPGYYTGGRIHPLLLGKRPNRFGYVLVVTGGLSFVLVILQI